MDNFLHLWLLPVHVVLFCCHLVLQRFRWILKRTMHAIFGQIAEILDQGLRGNLAIAGEKVG